ncbi:myozenin-1a [Conger conger]|uniref:myozenin-1a n=1 Tax=Conger conger TaxID=82655 RepID=UPI002A59F4AF|nr:myozenin-1a [Conger conger]
MPLSGTPAPNKRKKSSRLITDLSHITQEVNASEQLGTELDLGRKIGIPKDIMLEELSLLKNKGSLMFKMRQQRVERFIYENNPDVFTPDSMDELQKYRMGGKVDMGGHLIGGRMVVSGGYAGSGSKAPIPPPKPGSLYKGVIVGGAGGHAAGHGGSGGGAGGKGQGQGQGGGALDGSGALGAGGAGGDKGAGGGLGKKIDYARTYTSPWERAMKGNEELIATLKPHMAGPEMPHALRKYKSFNRSAMPYGGYEKASQLMTFQLPEVDVVEHEPTVVYLHDNRPSFNRTPIGWIGSGDTSHIHVQMDVPFDGETDEL